MADNTRRAGGIVDLASYRKSRGVTLRQIADNTKIGLRYLEAIEHSEFAKLPGGVYDLNYIRQYAREIDLDPSLVLDFYHSQMPAEQPAEEPSKPPALTGFLGLLWPVRHRRAA